MGNFRSLRVMDLFKGLFQTFGIHYPSMRTIVGLKLTMDERRIPVVFSQTKLKEGNQFLKSLGLYVLYGLVIIPFLFIGDSVMLQMGIGFGIAMFMIMTSLIADFSSVLLDVRDRILLAAAPVDDRTLNAAKLVHISIYITLIALSLLGIPSIVILVSKGILFFLLFLVMMIFLMLFIIALTAITYMVMLRVFDGERLKDMINYVQILLSVGVFVGYQVLIRSFDFVGLTISYEFSWWHILIPPLWFAAPFEWLLGGNGSQPLVMLSITAVIIPVFAIWMYIRKMPLFERDLQKLMTETRGGKQQQAVLMRFWGWVLCRNSEERASFRFSWQLMKRERDFKLKVYPSLGVGFVAPFLFLYIFLSDGTRQDMITSSTYFMIYFGFIVIGPLAIMLSYSGKFKGAWIFTVAPITSVSRVDRAALKASLAQLFLPVFIMQAVVFTVLFGWRIVPDLIVVLFSAVLYAAICYAIGAKGTLPFSLPMGESVQSGTAKQIILMLLIGVFVGIHILMNKIPYGTPIYLVVIVLGCLVGWKTLLPIKRHYV
ncbi:hypothetical protein ABE021_07665 [Sporosarcina gallistercoris]|uniref:hypothetical protein n=1 Tax=Sporosarcina gallistercoris TaxID=2762245 RepID=UPI003D2C7D9E